MFGGMLYRVHSGKVIMGTQPRAGLYEKFRVERVHGEDKDGEEFMVLSPTHDILARPAILRYADECEKVGLKELANDIRDGIARCENGGPFYPIRD